MRKAKEVIREKDTEVIFELKKDNSFPVYLNDNKEEFYVLTVSVKICGVKIATYQRGFQQEISTLHFYGFIKKFLEDPVYRQQFLINGKWDEKLSFSDSMNDVHPSCKEQIEYINNSKNLRFKDFLNLKTFGIDKYSKMKLAELEDIVPPEQQEEVKREFHKEEYILSALRWIARGLKPEHAIRKVKCDIEIRQNAQRIRTNINRN